MYTAIVMDIKSIKKLREILDRIDVVDWTTMCHHVTVNMGGICDGPMSHVSKGADIGFAVTHIGGIDGKVIAVKAEVTYGNFHTINNTSHITLAVNYDSGGKPVMSNDISVWYPIPHIIVDGTLQEC